MDIRDMLKGEIEKRGITQKCICEKTGIKQSALSATLNNSPKRRRLTADEFFMICEALGVRADYFKETG